MSEAAIVYSAMNSAASKADNVARKIDSYSDEITKKVLNKLNNYGGDWSGNLSDARSSLNAKINSLNSDYNSYKGYATDIRTAVNQCKQTDDDVRETVKNLSSTFKVSHGIRDNVIENYLSYFFTSIGNSNANLRLVSDTLETIGEAGSELISCLKTWWNYDGGKQLVTGVAVAVLEIAAAVAGIVVAVMSGAGIVVLLATIVGGVITISNGLMNLANEALAYWTVMEDPATARRLSNQNTIQDVLREGTLLNQDSWVNQHVNISYSIAMGIDVTNFACGLIKLWDSGFKAFQSIKNWAGANGGLFGGLKNFAHSIKSTFQRNGLNSLKIFSSDLLLSFKTKFSEKFLASGGSTLSQLKSAKSWLGLAKDVFKNDEGIGGLLKIGLTKIVFPCFILSEQTSAANQIKVQYTGEWNISIDTFYDVLHEGLYEKIYESTVDLRDANQNLNLVFP